MTIDTWDLGFNVLDPTVLGGNITEDYADDFESGTAPPESRVYDTDASWTDDEWIGYTLDITIGDKKGSYIISDNGADWIEVSGEDFSAVSEDGYRILTVPAGEASDGETLTEETFPTTAPEQAPKTLVQWTLLDFYVPTTLEEPSARPEVIEPQTPITLAQHNLTDYHLQKTLLLPQARPADTSRQVLETLVQYHQTDFQIIIDMTSLVIRTSYPTIRIGIKYASYGMPSKRRVIAPPEFPSEAPEQP